MSGEKKGVKLRGTANGDREDCKLKIANLSHKSFVFQNKKLWTFVNNILNSPSSCSKHSNKVFCTFCILYIDADFHRYVTICSTLECHLCLQHVLYCSWSFFSSTNTTWHIVYCRISDLRKTTMRPFSEWESIRCELQWLNKFENKLGCVCVEHSVCLSPLVCMWFMTLNPCVTRKNDIHVHNSNETVCHLKPISKFSFAYSSFARWAYLNGCVYIRSSVQMFNRPTKALMCNQRFHSTI